MDASTAFGHWLAGFTDGEGCFSIDRSSGRAVGTFRLQLRDDDRNVLESILARLGVGAIHRQSHACERRRGMNSRDAISYQVRALSEKMQLVQLFDTYCLQTKKRNDYAIWRKMVFAEAAGESTLDLVRFIQPLRDARVYRPAKVSPALEMSDEAFGHWAAGFTDGEGSFGVYSVTRGRPRSMFRISLRDDDRAVLETIRDRLDIGTIRGNSSAAARCRGVKQRDSVTYGVQGLADKVQLVDLFDRYPLRSKKARDYVIWREAVLAEAGGESTRDLVRFIEPLRAARAYRAPLDCGRAQKEIAILDPLVAAVTSEPGQAAGV